MDDGDQLDFSDLCVGNGYATSGSGCSMSMDSFFATIFGEGDTAEHHTCTHTHTCVPPVDDPSHAHTCVHFHTTTVAAAAPPDAASPSGSKKPPSGGGNRIAVRKYREKKKAHAALLEQQMHHFKVLNQRLTARVAALEAEKLVRDAELNRFRCLLVEFRGRIDGEIGAAFPYQIQSQRPVNNIDLQVPASVDHGQQGAFFGISSGSCDSRCNNDQMYCNPGAGMTSSVQVVLGQQGACDGSNIQCIGSTTLPACGGMDTSGPAGCSIQNVEKN